MYYWYFSAAAGKNKYELETMSTDSLADLDICELIWVRNILV